MRELAASDGTPTDSRLELDRLISAFLLRARGHGWQKGLRASALVITDVLTAAQLPAGCEARVYRVVADTSLEELKKSSVNSSRSSPNARV